MVADLLTGFDISWPHAVACIPDTLVFALLLSRWPLFCVLVFFPLSGLREVSEVPILFFSVFMYFCLMMGDKI